VFEANGHPICVDCNLKIQQAFQIRDNALKEQENFLLDQMEAVTGLYGVTPRHKIQTPVIHRGPMNFHSINVDRSVVGAINTGSVQKMEVALNNIHSNNQNPELEDRLQEFTEAVLKDAALSVQTKDDIVEQLTALAAELGKQLICAVVEMKQRNPNWGCPRIAQQMALAFNIQIDKDVVRRILARHYRPGQDSDGTSWLTFLGHMKDSLWSMDLFRCESATLRTHWVLVVMDQYTRRIIGFGVHAGTLNGVALCKMFNRAIRGQLWMPKYISSDNDPLYRFHQWQANLRILEVTEIKSIPYVPLSHPFVERLIGTIRREYLDHTLFWTTVDLENKLLDFRTHFNNHRTHTSREGRTPVTPVSRPIADLRSFRWQPHCRALYQTPVAA
jgi:transposase InsO family protein